MTAYVEPFLLYVTILTILFKVQPQGCTAAQEILPFEGQDCVFPPSPFTKSVGWPTEHSFDVIKGIASSLGLWSDH